ncbi:MAG TPA: enoyl-CoA hydratase/isomerase family protein [Gemmatimonadaceae bacterium]|nr:enoyl-CoA hydratase/isomerase family protein [Gemmatimonadaceae bacterium]
MSTSDEASAAASRQAGSVTVSVASGVATVEFHHPKGNSLPALLLTRLASEITAVGPRADAQVIVLRSAGSGAFCGGASFDEFSAVDNAAAGAEFFSGFGRVILAMIRSPKFIVTRVQGRVAGGGIGLVAASDYTLAARSASVRLSELALGIGPFVVGPVIERKIGLAAFSAMTVDADWRDADWCETHGLFSRLCGNAGELDAEIASISATLSKSNPEAMAHLKKVFWTGTEKWDELLAVRAGLSGAMMLSDFTRRAIEAFRARY